MKRKRPNQVANLLLSLNVIFVVVAVSLMLGFKTVTVALAATVASGLIGCVSLALSQPSRR